MDITKHPQLYKKKSLSEVKNRPTSNLSDTEKTRVGLVINTFFEFFKSKHL
jgi:hypothetical protein